jgi:predicted nicotinamide N-methyase
VKTFRKHLRSHLRGLTEFTETFVEVGDRTYSMTHPAAADALIDEEEFAQDERIPYWADLWPSSVALARHASADEPLVGRRAVELGCGIGLPSVVALARGADILGTDHYEAALDFARYNALVNLGCELRTRILDWHSPRTQDLGTFDLVLVADVLYEQRNLVALTALIPTLLAPGGEVLLADPGRKNAPVFLEGMRDLGFGLSTEECLVPWDDRTVTTFVHRLRSC